MSPLLLAARLATLKGTAEGASEYFTQLSGHIILAMGDTLSSVVFNINIYIDSIFWPKGFSSIYLKMRL